MYADDLECNPKHGTNDQQYGLFANILADAAILSAAYNSVSPVTGLTITKITTLLLKIRR